MSVDCISQVWSISAFALGVEEDQISLELLDFNECDNFWGAKGAPILFSDLVIRMASCSYICISYNTSLRDVADL